MKTDNLKTYFSKREQKIYLYLDKNLNFNSNNIITHI